MMDNVASCFLHLNPSIRDRWNMRSSFALKNLIFWCNHSQNFVSFAHFWITSANRSTRENYLTLQYDSLHKELSLALEHIEGEDAALTLLRLTLPEYPKSLFNYKLHTFLRMLHKLRTIKLGETSENIRNTVSDGFFQDILDSDIKSALKDTRFFCLIMLWCSVISLYHKLAHGFYVSFETSDYEWPNDTPIITGHQSQCDAIEPFQCLDLEFSDVIEYMLKSGRLHINSCFNENGETLIHHTVKTQKQDLLKYIIRKYEKQMGTGDGQNEGDFINKPDMKGDTALHLACKHGSKDIVSLLLAFPCIDVNYKNMEDDDSTPLHVAALNGHANVVKLLISHGADVTCQMNGKTVLDLTPETQPFFGTLQRRIRDVLKSNRPN